MFGGENSSSQWTVTLQYQKANLYAIIGPVDAVKQQSEYAVRFNPPTAGSLNETEKEVDGPTGRGYMLALCTWP